MFKLYFKLAQKLDVSRRRIDTLASGAPNKYKVYTIPKRTSGLRVIAHPSREVKVYQRALIKILQDVLRVHHCSYAYKKKLSIKDNALRHASNRYLLKMDFNDFFNSITPEVFEDALNHVEVDFSEAETKLIKHLVFWNKNKSFPPHLVLSVGAPTSPLISNFIMYEFDKAMYDFCEENLITYTRYADDITFSTNVKDILFKVPNKVNKILEEKFNGAISINQSKTIFSSKAHNRHITGITITNQGSLSIGRSRKRMISSLIHKFMIGEIDYSDFKYLQGLLSFSSHIEPSFISSMRKKYGEGIIGQVIKGDFNE